MEYMFPEKLVPGDELRVIAPSTSFHVINPAVREVALKNLSALGLKVTYGRHAEECDLFNSSSVNSRLEDLHEAFSDPEVKAILTAIGGYNSNQLLRHLDYDLIKANPKIVCGYSDITALAAAIHARTGLVTYSGPHFSTFGMEQGLGYTLEYFQKCLMKAGPFIIEPSTEWSDDKWARDQQERTFIRNAGCVVIYEGSAEGTLLGGNLCTLNLLQGTEYMPPLAGSLLLLEDDYESKALTFDRDLQSLLHQPGFSEVRGMVIGRFQKESAMTTEKLIGIIASKAELGKIPVIANADFGHTTPQFTFPIGGKGRLVAMDGSIEFSILAH
jgi:muramoyltetrapeptide carboxypeptidase LdcA involved in peptidoglycan recycling